MVLIAIDQAGQWYNSGFDIRDFKVTIKTEKLRARSEDTIIKELYGSLIAHNLIKQIRRDAAKIREEKRTNTPNEGKTDNIGANPSDYLQISGGWSHRRRSCLKRRLVR